MSEPLVSLREIRLRYGSHLALDGAGLELRPGEVHGVLGENGAGKSTLLGVLAGLLAPESGKIVVDGAPTRFRSPREAWAAGIGLVHQHFRLVGPMSVLENLALGRRSAAGGWRLPFDEVRAAARTLAARTGLTVPLDVSVEALGVGDRQRVEILKVLLRSPRVLALDEPTAVLAPQEVERLFGLLRTLAREGRAVALVAHKLDEILAVADRVTVLRGGRTVLTAPRHEVDAATLAAAMVGSEEADTATGGRGEPRPAVGAVVASCRDLEARPDGAVRGLDGASLEVRRGEVVGVAGVDGNGQHALALALSGRLHRWKGVLAVPEGVGFIPQDRTREGLVLDFDLAENVALAPAWRRGRALLDWPALRSAAWAYVRRYGIRARSVHVPVRTLSGGNQQRLVVAREISAAGDLLVAENPTRGLDVAATRFVRETIRKLAADAGGPGVLLISTDLDEILELSDRVYVAVRGRLHPVPAGDVSREGIGRLMLGVGASEGPVRVEGAG